MVAADVGAGVEVGGGVEGDRGFGGGGLSEGGRRVGGHGSVVRLQGLGSGGWWHRRFVLGL